MITFIALIAAASLTPAAAPPRSDPPPLAAGAPRLPGYLAPGEGPNTILILPPPPAPGSTADRLDRETYEKTRAMASTPRWALAARDAAQYIPAFDCVVGVKLEDGPPAVTRLFLRTARDVSVATNLAKDHYARLRPFVAPNGPICTEGDRAMLKKSYSYPSGHATYGWTIGLILAELVPDRASDILARARAFGESRVVCGVHTVSDVEEGRTNASALVAVLHANAAFQADLRAAGAALAAVRAAPQGALDPAECRVEAEAETHTPWINPTGPK